MAPETLEGKPEDFRSDMYSLGATLFHALAGRPPHDVESNSMGALAAAKKAPVNLAAVAPTVSSATAYALNKVLNFDPAQRQQSYAEFIEHLEFARAGLLGILPKHEKSGAAQTGRPRSYRWLTYATAAVTVAVGVTAFEMRARVLARNHPSEETPETPATEESADITYDQARQLLAAGDVAKAIKAFTTLEAKTDTPQPQKNWITLHTALAELLAGHADLADGWFKVVANRGKYSPDLAEQSLATFFLDVAQRAGGDKVITADSAKDLDRRNYEALALLLYGLKDWSLGEYDEASTLFRQYAQITPDSRFTWVADYKPLVSPFVSEVNAYHPAEEAAKSADTLETRKQALQAVKEARGRIKLAAGFAAYLDEEAQDLQQKITAEEEETARRLAAMEAADTRALADAKSKIGPLWQQFRPLEAKAVMNAVQVSGGKAQQERETWLKKLTWLARFRAALHQRSQRRGLCVRRSQKIRHPIARPHPPRERNADRNIHPLRHALRAMDRPHAGWDHRHGQVLPATRPTARATRRTPVAHRRLRLLCRQDQGWPRPARARHPIRPPA